MLIPENLSFTELKLFNPDNDPEPSEIPQDVQTIEGTIVLSPDDKLLNITRFVYDRHALCYELDKDNPGAPLKYLHLMKYTAHHAKFVIQYDKESGKYFTIANYIYNPETKFLINVETLFFFVDFNKFLSKKKIVVTLTNLC